MVAGVSILTVFVANPKVKLVEILYHYELGGLYLCYCLLINRSRIVTVPGAEALDILYKSVPSC